MGIDTSALSAAIHATEAKLQSDASLSEKAGGAAAAANLRAESALASAEAATSTLSQTEGAVRGAAVFLYMAGPASLAVNPAAGSSIAYAAVYADSALSPYGILAARKAELGQRKSALRELEGSPGRRAQKQARKQGAAPGRRAGPGWLRLQAELRDESQPPTAAEVTADHVAVAGQAGKELLSGFGAAIRAESTTAGSSVHHPR